LKREKKAKSRGKAAFLCQKQCQNMLHVGQWDGSNGIDFRFFYPG